MPKPSPLCCVLLKQSYAATTSSVIYIWYHITSLHEEVDLFWGSSFTCATVLFLANRYLALLSALLSVHGWDFGSRSIVFHSILQTCTVVNLSRDIIFILQSAVWAAFSALRTHALSKRWTYTVLVTVLSVVTALSVVPILVGAAQLYVVPPGPHADSAVGECVALAKDVSPLVFIVLNIVSRVCLVVADGVIVAVTWAAAYRPNNVRTLALLGRKTLLSSILLRDGSIYFIILTALNVLHLVLIGFEEPKTVQGSVIGWFIPPLTSILLSAFIIDLRASAREGWHTSSAWSRTEWASTAMRSVRAADGAHSSVHFRDMGSATSLSVGPATDGEVVLDIRRQIWD
ncbi:hypothetical protein BD413DRAFT_272671 [Trametes elegans]|nr:hypothetical protein BD413DRAFT_272671 [Trametes elegans]